MSKNHMLKAFLLGGAGGAGGILLTKMILGDFSPRPLASKPLEEFHQKNLKPMLEPTPAQLRTQKILKYGAPTACLPDRLHYQNHVLQYDASRRTPKWVAEHITRDMVNKQEANRKNVKFKADPVIPLEFSSTNKDFWNSGWSRGHMAPAGNNKHCQASMNDTFFLTNVVPQDIDNNGNYWNRLEIYCRQLTEKFEDVYVISGPLWLPKVKLPPSGTVKESEGCGDIEFKQYNQVDPKKVKASPSERGKETEGCDDNELKQSNQVSRKKVKLPPSERVKEKEGCGDTEFKKSDQVDHKKVPETNTNSFRKERPPPKYVEYQVIGENNVAVPTHLYKVMLVEDPRLDAPLVAGFVIPNTPIEDKHLKEFQVKIVDLERHAGLKFHVEMDPLVVPGDLCEVEGCKMQDYKEFQQFFWKRRLSSPGNIRSLERDWEKATSKKVATPELEAIYLEKRVEMLEKEKVWEEKKRMEQPSEQQTVAVAA